MSGWIVFNFTLLTIFYGLFAKPLDQHHEMIEVEMLPTNIIERANPRNTADEAPAIATASQALPLLDRKKREWYWHHSMHNFPYDMDYYRKYHRSYRSKYSVWDLS